MTVAERIQAVADLVPEFRPWLNGLRRSRRHEDYSSAKGDFERLIARVDLAEAQVSFLYHPETYGAVVREISNRVGI
jgi:hypothetical protein